MNPSSSDPEDTHVDLTPFIQPAKQNIQVPYRVGPYHIKGLLKRGGTSLLYLGVHADSSELIAIKVLSPKYMAHPEMIEHFLKEAKIIELADHPNIVRLYGHGKWEGGLYISMEFIRGISLRKLILQNILSFRRSLEIILEISQALSHLHSHGIVHRDIKPDNILLSEEGGVKVIDFGISRIMEEKGAKKKIMGTPTYMSPEQKENPLSVSYTSDIYSLAIIAYELCIGRLSYGVVQLSLLPKGLRKILTRALMPNPKDRFANIHEFIEELSLYVEQTFEENEELLDLSLKELSEFYENVYLSLQTKDRALNQKISIKKVTQKGILSSHLFYEAFALNNDTSALMVGWPEKKGVLGIFNNGVLKGLLQALRQPLLEMDENVLETSEHFLKELDRLLQVNKLGRYSFMFLIMSSTLDLFHFFSFGPNQLWIHPAGSHSAHEVVCHNDLLGCEIDSQISHVSSNWNLGDTLFLSSSFHESPLKEDDLNRAINQSELLTGHSQVQAILNDLTQSAQKTSKTAPLMVMSLQRKR